MGKRLLIILICLVGMAPQAWASGLADTYGFGSRPIALGGAFTAVADDYSAAYYNPAGLAQNTGSSMTLDFIYASPDIEVKNMIGQDLVTLSADGSVVRNNPTEYRGGRGLDLQVPIIGATFDINALFHNKALPNMQMGLCLAPGEQGDVLYRIHSFPPDQPHFLRYGDNISRINIVIGLSIEAIPEMLYLGAGVQSMLAGDGVIYMDRVTMGLNPQNLYPASQAEISSMMKNHAHAGALLTLLDQKLKIGLAARPEFELIVDPTTALMSLTMPVVNEVDLTMLMGMLAYYTPAEVAAGLAYDAEKWMVSADLTWQQWSKYEYSPGDKTIFNPVNVNDSVVAQGIESGKPEFNDTFNLKLGFEYRINEMASVMCGYGYQPSPVPDQSYKISNYIDMDKHILSAGASYSFYLPFLGIKEPLKLAGTIQYQMFDDLEVVKNGVRGFTWIDQESYTVEGSALAGGLAVSVAW